MAMEMSLRLPLRYRDLSTHRVLRPLRITTFAKRLQNNLLQPCAKSKKKRTGKRLTTTQSGICFEPVALNMFDLLNNSLRGTTDTATATVLRI